MVAPITTAYFVLKNQQKKVRREVKWKLIEGIDRSELVLFKFTEEDKETKLNWKHSKEFEYKGEMYDIAETEFHGDTTYYWCWWDYEETALNKQLDKLFAYALGNTPSHKQNQEKIIQIYKSLYFNEEELLSNSKIEFDLEASLVYNYQRNFQNWVQSPDSPPPQLS